MVEHLVVKIKFILPFFNPNRFSLFGSCNKKIYILKKTFDKPIFRLKRMIQLSKYTLFFTKSIPQYYSEFYEFNVELGARIIQPTSIKY